MKIPDADGSGALAIIVGGWRSGRRYRVVVSANSAAMISEAGNQKKIVPRQGCSAQAMSPQLQACQGGPAPSFGAQ